MNSAVICSFSIRIYFIFPSVLIASLSLSLFLRLTFLLSQLPLFTLPLYPNHTPLFTRLTPLPLHVPFSPYSTSTLLHLLSTFLSLPSLHTCTYLSAYLTFLTLPSPYYRLTCSPFLTFFSPADRQHTHPTSSQSSFHAVISHSVPLLTLSAPPSSTTRQ